MDDLAKYTQTLQCQRREISQLLKDSEVDLKSFYRVSHWNIGWYFMVTWGATLGVMVFYVEGVSRFWHAGLAVVATWIGFGFVQHAMINVLHEAGHRNLSRNERLNEWVGNLLFALPIGLTVERYRISHQAHHELLASEDDPTGFISSPKLTRGQVVWNLLSLLFGRALWDMALSTLFAHRVSSAYVDNNVEVSASDRKRLLFALVFHGCAVSLAYVLGWLEIWVIWAVAAATMAPFLDGMRTAAEHRRTPSDGPEFHTRSHHTNMLISAIFAPFFQYHWEHHIFPGIPHSQLGRFHRMMIRFGQKGAVPVRGGFFGALAMGFRAGGREA